MKREVDGDTDHNNDDNDVIGADVFIDALLHRMEHDASFFVDAVHCARLPPPARAVVGQVRTNLFVSSTLTLTSSLVCVCRLWPRQHIRNCCLQSCAPICGSCISFVLNDCKSYVP